MSAMNHPIQNMNTPNYYVFLNRSTQNGGMYSVGLQPNPAIARNYFNNTNMRFKECVCITGNPQGCANVALNSLRN